MALRDNPDKPLYDRMVRSHVEPGSTYKLVLAIAATTGSDLYSEFPGLVPDAAYFDRKYGKGKWSKGLLLNLSVGQGDLLVTPLQMATFAMYIANRGLGFRPHVRKRIVDPVTGDEEYFIPDTVRIEGIRACACCRENRHGSESAWRGSCLVHRFRAL